MSRSPSGQLSVDTVPENKTFDERAAAVHKMVYRAKTFSSSEAKVMRMVLIEKCNQIVDDLEWTPT